MTMATGSGEAFDAGVDTGETGGSADALAALILSARAQVAGAETKVQKQRDHLDGALEALAVAKNELAVLEGQA